ncbi:MAG: iron-siderophore ABC transporter substrate-binding protein [Cyanobacteria bacterium P01_D01_bin.56]
MRPIRFILIALSATLLVVACQSAAVEQPNETTADCRIVNHELGETQICGQPKTVAVISPRVLDSMLALGVQPAAFAQAVSPGIEIFDNPMEQIPYIGKWVTTKPIGLGSRNTPSLERLKLLQPDLILGEPWQSSFYNVMNQIAPTLFFNDDQDPNQIGSWQQDITEIAKALGREDKVKDVLAQHKDQIVKVRETLQPVIKKHPRISFVTANVEMTQIKSGSNTSLARLLGEIGFEVLLPPGYIGNGSVPLSSEVIPDIDSDLMIVAAWDSDLALNPEESTPQESLRDRWAQTPLLSSMPALQQGKVVFVDYYLSGGVTRGPLSDQVLLESLPDLLLPTIQAATSGA